MFECESEKEETRNEKAAEERPAGVNKLVTSIQDEKLQAESRLPTDTHTTQLFSYVICKLLRGLLEGIFHKNVTKPTSTSVPSDHSSIFSKLALRPHLAG